MPGLGKWSIQPKWKRCTGQRKCSACAANPERAPHGPYYELRRRHPETGEQQAVYIGIWPLTDKDMELINETFRGKIPPTRSEVILVVEQAYTP